MARSYSKCSVRLRGRAGWAAAPAACPSAAEDRCRRRAAPALSCLPPRHPVRSFRALAAWRCCVGGHLHVEFERRVVLDEPHGREGQVLRVVRDPRDRGERRRHLGVIEERRLRLLQRIDEVEPPALAGLVGVPEAIASLEPAWRHVVSKTSFDTFCDVHCAARS